MGQGEEELTHEKARKISSSLQYDHRRQSALGHQNFRHRHLRPRFRLRCRLPPPGWVPFGMMLA